MRYSFLLFTFSDNFEQNANTEKLESCFHLRIFFVFAAYFGLFRGYGTLVNFDLSKAKSSLRIN